MIQLLMLTYCKALAVLFVMMLESFIPMCIATLIAMNILLTMIHIGILSEISTSYNKAEKI